MVFLEHICSVLWENAPPSCAPAGDECNKYDLTAGPCFWLVNHNDWSKWFAISSSHLFAILLPVFLVCGLCRRPKCYHVLNWFFLPKPSSFLEFILNFQRQKSLKNQYLLRSESKCYQINSTKILLIKIFPMTRKAHSNSSKILRSYSI
jgi:hypothetical protein